MHCPLRRVVCFVFLSSSFATSFAITPPPAIPFSSFPQETALQSSPLTELTMGSLRVRLEETSLDEVRAAASAGAIEHQGDAGESIYWLCYTNLKPTPAERIWLLSDGEMGGDVHRITGVSAQRLPGAQATADCPALPVKFTPLKLESRIWLDMPPQVARIKLGMFSFKSGNWESYDYMGKVPGKCAGDGFDLTSSLMLQVVKGRIHSLRINRITSC